MDNRQEYTEADAELDEGYYTGSAQEVATALGVTTAGLRRIADIYDTVYPPLKRDERQNNRRLWTRASIDRLGQARRLVQAEKARSIKAALESVKTGDATPSEDALASPHPPSQDAVLLAVLEHVQRLEARIETMQRQLEAPKSAETELERTNRYLLGELQRRRTEAEAPRRAWWQLWGRK